jgi:uncharacterized membrane protein YphA (DoxX/SURF4 family)
MKKRDRIIYWIATVWLALGMVSTGTVQLLRMEEEVLLMNRLGYPVYILSILGIWKLLGSIAVLVPRFPRIKKWAYAGFFFVMSGAVFSHIASGSGATDFFGPLLLIILTLVSWYFRPAEKRIVSVNQGSEYRMVESASK